MKKTKWPCKKDCNIWITVLKIQTLTIENVRTKKRLKNIKWFRKKEKDCNIQTTVSNI